MKTNFIKSFSLLLFAVTTLLSCDSAADEPVQTSENAATTVKYRNYNPRNYNPRNYNPGNVKQPVKGRGRNYNPRNGNPSSN